MMPSEYYHSSYFLWVTMISFFFYHLFLFYIFVFVISFENHAWECSELTFISVHMNHFCRCLGLIRDQGLNLNKLRARQALFLLYSLSSQISSFWWVSCRDRGQSLNWLWSAALLLKGQQLLFDITTPLECLVVFKPAWAFPFMSQGSNEQPGVRFWKGAENRLA